MNAASTANQPAPDVSIVGGAGHVGLPLGLVFAHKGMRVLLVDINAEALEIIRSGRMPAIDEGAEPILQEALKKGLLQFSTKTAEATRAKNIVITIGTPVDEFHTPEHRLMQRCINDLLPGLNDDHLLLLRSTVSPGTTEWVHRYLQRHGKKSLVSFCPERVVQGFSIRELQEMPQIVSGATPAAASGAARLFGTIAKEIIELAPMEAEFAKLFANAYRYIQFAVTNQFYMIANSAGVNYTNVLRGMTHNYPRAKGMPGPGFAAGPCLFKDTMQLVAFAQNKFNLGHDAMLVNEGLVLYIVDRLRQRYDLHNMTVGLLGMAFKSDSDDTRSSLSYKLKKLLATHAATVLTTDPLVQDDPDLRPLDEVLSRSDILVLCTPHSAYRGLDVRGKPLVDVWNHAGDGTI